MRLYEKLSEKSKNKQKDKYRKLKDKMVLIFSEGKDGS